MSAPRMNLFRNIAGAEKKKKHARKIEVKRIPVHLALAAALAVGTLLYHRSENRKHQETLAELRAQVAEMDNQVKEALAVAEAGKRDKDRDRKPALAAKPSGMDGSWTAVLWKFAAFTGQRVVIRDIQLAPLNNSKIQSVVLRAQAGSYEEVRQWLERLIENMPGSEFSIQNQKLVEDEDFPVAFTMTAQVI